MKQLTDTPYCTASDCELREPSHDTLPEDASNELCARLGALHGGQDPPDVFVGLPLKMAADSPNAACEGRALPSSRAAPAAREKAARRDKTCRERTTELSTKD